MAGEGTRGRIRVARMGPRKYHRDALRAKDYKRWEGYLGVAQWRAKAIPLSCPGRRGTITFRVPGRHHVTDLMRPLVPYTVAMVIR